MPLLWGFKGLEGRLVISTLNSYVRVAQDDSSFGGLLELSRRTNVRPAFMPL